MAEVITTSPLAHAIGVALVHFLWQGTILGALCAVLLAASHRRSAQARYLIGCTVLIAMTAAVVITFVAYARAFLSASALASAGSTMAALQSQVVASSSSAVSPLSDARWFASAGEWIEARWPIAVLIWSGGVFLFSLHLLRGWLLVERIRRSGSRAMAADWSARANVLAARLGIRRRLRLLESARVDVPSVIGWIRPIIIVPASALAGLSPSQFEAILAHELAHVRRHDYLVNVLQSVLEVLLFYHPAVWWVSRRVRLEREHCCDDLAVDVCGDRLAYAAALTSLEEGRRATPAFAMGARGGDLLGRVRRLVVGPQTSGRPLSGWAAIAGVVTIVSVVLGAHGQSAALASDSQPTAPMPSAASTASKPQNLAVVTRPERLAPPPQPGVALEAAVHATANVQDPSGTLTGTIIDETGGRIPGATVMVKAADGTVIARAVTNAPGRYAIASLPSGVYEVTVSMPGFKTSSITVQIGTSETRLDVRLHVGSLSETLTVMSPTPLPAAAPGAVTQTTAPPQEPRAPSPESNPVLVDPADTVVRVGGSIKEPRKIHDVKPIYPPDALAAGVQGVVIIEATIAKDGSVKDAKVLRGVAMLDEAALDAVAQWIFTPTLLNGVPVEVVMTVTVNFTGL